MAVQNNLVKVAKILAHVSRRMRAHAEKNAEVERKLPEVLDILVANDRITPEQRGAAAAMIKDASRCLDFIAALAKHRTSAGVAQSLGVPVNRTETNVRRPIGAPVIDFDEHPAGQMFRELVTS